MKPLRPQHVAKAKTPGLEAPDGFAAEVLGFLASDFERMRRFFDLTGLSPETLRHAAMQPGFVMNLLDYLASDDRVLVAFAAESGRDPEEIQKLRQDLALSGEGGV